MTSVFSSVISCVRRVLRLAGLQVIRANSADAPPSDLNEMDRQCIREARPYSLATSHRLASMLDAVDYIHRAGIAGAIVECGVWRGGNMILAAKALQCRGSVERDLYLYDTFQGMSAPTDADKDYSGKAAAELLAQEEIGQGFWCEASLEDVSQNMRATGYPEDHVHYVKGMVEETIPQTLPQEIALLRLDTDWYESTYHELEHLFPRLRPGGVLIIDDYGHWQGAKRAVDEYFQKLGGLPNLARIDYTCRMMVKSMNE
jgi:O-methyltransferase